MGSIFICLSVGVLVNGSQFHIHRWVGQSALPLTRLGVGVTVEWGWGPWGSPPTTIGKCGSRY